MKRSIFTLVTCYIFWITTSLAQVNLSQADWQEGFIAFHWDKTEGKLYARINKADTEMLYNTGLAAGVGSNDLGLDRGQLGDAHVVVFHRVGNKMLLIEKNYDYRAESDNPLERRAVEEAFAQSVLWGFEIKEEGAEGIIIDMTDFLLRDAHKISQTLSSNEEGNYSIDKSRSAIYLPRTKSFPKNTEFEATTTYVGTPKGRYLHTVTPSADAVTVRQHHSFIELPDDKFIPRIFKPSCGFYSVSFHDYATAIHEPVRKQYIARHRLIKKNPSAPISEAVNPIVYYVDPGAPEPIRSALIEGASWWNKAFEAAGYNNAFRVEVLPLDADPMDVRYNLIQWVHRSTRGWSYGGGVIDPRTGEIIKGHVSLGSLRVRQDFLIAQGLLPVFGKDGPGQQPLQALALARLRQLSAHEVGHTLGLAHNFAASANDRASVMDYPHPLVSLVNGNADFSNAYDDKIGAWDKRAIIYGYKVFDQKDESAELNLMLEENEKLGLRYLSDQDARSPGSASPYAHLWDNGENAVAELKRIGEVRTAAMEVFGMDNIPGGSSMATLEDVFVPLYLSHRYQVAAAAKLIGGVDYSYSTKRLDQSQPMEIVSPQRQTDALVELLKTIDPRYLMVSDRIANMIPPRVMGDQRGREQFTNRSSPTFDALGAAEASASHTLSLLLNAQRLSRLVDQHSRDEGHLSLKDYLKNISKHIRQGRQQVGYARAIAEVVQFVYVRELMRLVMDSSSHHHVRGAAIDQLQTIKAGMTTSSHDHVVIFEIEQFMKDPNGYTIPAPIKLPDGSPIGCGGH